MTLGSGEMAEREGGFGGGGNYSSGFANMPPGLSSPYQNPANVPAYNGGGGEQGAFVMGPQEPTTKTPAETQSWYDASQPTWGQRFATRAASMVMPGFSFETMPDYAAGAPQTVTRFNPLGFASSFLGPAGFNPMGDMLAPKWADIEVGRQPTGEPHHAEHTGRSGETTGGGAMEDRWRQLVRSIYGTGGSMA